MFLLFLFGVHLQVLVFARVKDERIPMLDWQLVEHWKPAFFLKLKSDQNVDSKRKSPISGP